MKELNKLQLATYIFAKACEGNPVASTIVVMLFYGLYGITCVNLHGVIFS